MQLHDLSAGGDWRAMWNGEVLPYLRSQQLIAGAGLRLDRRPAGTLIRTLPEAVAPAATGAAESEGYRSYFKLTLSSATANDATTYTVKIADGATGGASTAVVNGYTTYAIQPYTEQVTNDRLFFLKYTPAQYNASGQQTAAATLVIASLGPTGSTFPTLPAGGTDNAFYMQLGRCLWNSGAPTVVQDHTAGVAAFNWYVYCNRFTS